ncbi:MAG: hypothetical protein RMJ84_13790 [Sandaracinaceae bacterium]|nr:hypothetical protein [Sandaracinaceae bacterium]
MTPQKVTSSPSLPPIDLSQSALRERVRNLVSIQEILKQAATKGPLYLPYFQALFEEAKQELKQVAMALRGSKSSELALLFVHLYELWLAAPAGSPEEAQLDFQLGQAYEALLHDLRLHTA